MADTQENVIDEGLYSRQLYVPEYILMIHFVYAGSYHDVARRLKFMNIDLFWLRIWVCADSELLMRLGYA